MFVQFCQSLLIIELPFILSLDFSTIDRYFRMFLTNIGLFKVNIRNSRKTCEICFKVTIKTPERRQLLRFGVFIVNFERIFFSNVSINDLEQVNVSWVVALNFTWVFDRLSGIVLKDQLNLVEIKECFWIQSLIWEKIV